MSGTEAVVFAGGLFVILGGWAWAYRYTLSPKAAQRMEAANRNYRPWREQSPEERREAWIAFVTVYALWGVALLLFDGVGMWVPMATLVAFRVYSYRKARAREKREA
jgi:hypothetical protein